MKFAAISVMAAAAIISAQGAMAAPITVGNSGVAGPNGVVTAPPADGPNYRYVSTFGGVAGAGQIAGAGGTTGSSYTTDVFTANSGSILTFYFNYVTSDGAGFSDYAWSALLDSSGASVVDYIFSARTTPTGNTVPGFGLPGLNATLSPSSTPIIPGGPVWAQLGGSSGDCFAAGCGYTGWIQATYTIATAGNYRIGFGVTNSIDGAFQSGMAFTSSIVDGEVIDPTPAIPEPSTWAMLIAGFGLVGAAARRRRLETRTA
jgi:hypothetical protein